MKGVEGNLVRVGKDGTDKGIERVESNVKRSKAEFKEGMDLCEKG